MPVQEAVCSLFTEDSAQDHIQNVVSALSERRLLTPDNLAHVLETLESDGGAAASIRMLAFLYKIQAERARQEFARVEGRPEETEASEEGSERRPVWLEVLLDLVERHGGQGVRQTIPAGLLTSEVWTGALEDNTRARELDMESREFARTLRYTGLSEGEEGDPERIRLRAYQEELLLTARDGKNVVILLPTGTGKTFIVIKYVQEYLSKPGLGRVVFLAPKVKLAEQQYRRFQHFFPKTTYFRCGRYRVYVMTPMCLVEAVRAGEVQIPDFSLMVLDECHHTLGKHPYKDLMDLYMDAKFSADMPRLPQRYQRALILNEDCESKYALDYLTEQARLVEEPGNITQTERQMLADFQRQTPQLKRACEDPEDYNPKLGMLEDVLCGIIEKHQDEASCMVFVRTLELSKAIQQWMKDHPVLQELEPGRITGSRKSVFHGGMTRLESEDVMKGFNAGKHKVVVCTSAAEEGLDFQACNIVVRYDYVTSMVAMIQTRGRARRMDSQYVVMGHEAKGNVDKERENLASERLMRQAVTRMQQNMDDNPNAFRGAMDRNQKSQWTTRQLAEEAKSSSRVVIKEDFRRKWKRVERAYDNEIYQDLEKVAKVHCNNKDENGDDCSFDWGCLVKYIPSGREYPVLKLESFFSSTQGPGKDTPGS
nr:hypothetical protein BaRGS_033076 [Batillaria attramentaria]